MVCCANLGGRVFAANRVSLSSTSAVVTEGNDQLVQVQLDGPIIGPGPGAPFLHINFTSSDPSRVTVSPNPLEYAPNEWAQTKTFTLHVLHDNMHNASNTVTISFLVDSDSEYYKNYAGSFVLTITDVDPAPAITIAPAPPVSPAVAAALAKTGVDDRNIQLISLFALLGSVAGITIVVVRGKRNSAKLHITQ